MKLRTMGSFKFKVYTIITIFIIIAASIAIFWVYTNTMTTKKGNINVTKLTVQDKIYVYSVFGDFYFRVKQFGPEGKKEIVEFSELIPTRLNIGYDFKEKPPKLVISSEDASKAMVLNSSDQSTLDTNEFINKLHDFSKLYAKIYVAQDQYYFNKAKTTAEKIYSNLFDNKTNLASFEQDDFFEKSINTPIPNLFLKPYKLSSIKKNLKSFSVAPENQWQPNIVEWIFNENDRIYIQYLAQTSSANLNDYIENKSFSDKILIKTIKPNSGSIKPIFLEVDLKNNKLNSYVMDQNGYIYIIIFRAQNKISLYKNLNDYLKIVYGLDFKPVKDFTNTFAKKQDRYIMIASLMLDNLDRLKQLDNKIDDRLQNMLANELDNVSKSINAIYKILKQNYPYFSMLYNDIAAIYFVQYIKDNTGNYPNEKMLNDINKMIKKAEEFNSIIDNAKKQIGGFFNDKVKIILNNCKNIECIKQKNLKEEW